MPQPSLNELAAREAAVSAAQSAASAAAAVAAASQAASQAAVTSSDVSYIKKELSEIKEVIKTQSMSFVERREHDNVITKMSDQETRIRILETDKSTMKGQIIGWSAAIGAIFAVASFVAGILL